VILDQPDTPDDIWYYRRSQSIGVALTSDEGATWRLSATASTPDRFCNENMLYVMNDGRLRMFARTRTGRIWETYSSDNGETWGEVQATDLANPNSRFFVGKLANGNVVLLNNPSDVPDMGHHARTSITIRVSTDDGATWSADRVLAAGQWIAYPDAIEDDEGGLHVTYDTGRQNVVYCHLSPEELGGR